MQLIGSFEVMVASGKKIVGDEYYKAIRMVIYGHEIKIDLMVVPLRDP